MDGGDREKQMSIEISALVKAKNDSLRRSRALEAKRRKQCQSKETANSSENIPASQATRPRAERLQESLIAGSSPAIRLKTYSLCLRA